MTGARVTAGFAMLDMEMGTQSYKFEQTAPGVYGAPGAGAGDGRPLGAGLRRRAAGGEPFTIVFVDRAGG